jgi:hypothetical protein
MRRPVELKLRPFAGGVDVTRDQLSGARHRLRLAAVVVGLVAGCLAGCTSHSTPTDPSSTAKTPSTGAGSSSRPPLGYRSLPAFLPTTATPVDRVVTASPTHRQLAVQGVGVQIQLPTGHVLATVTGPTVPPFVAPPPPAVTATFEVSLANAAGSIPVRLSDFILTDQLGRSFHPTLVENEAPPPATLTGGTTTHFEVTAVMPTGEGRLYWAPTHATPIVGWDFIVEND